MDCSWLMDDESNEDPESDSDPEEAQSELETRLYSIVHHSDLSQPLPPELAKHYLVQCEDDGKLMVALNDSLENIKSEEVKKVEQLINNAELDNEDSEVIGCSPEKDDAILIPNNTFNSEQNSRKRFRYSDVNLDRPDLLSEVNEKPELSSSDISYSDLNFFKITESILKKKNFRRLSKDLVIPDSFQTGQYPNSWKDAANESFISVRADPTGSENEIIDSMVSVLKKVNPNKSMGKLYFICRALYTHNRRRHRKRQRHRQNKAKEKSLDYSLEVDSETLNCESGKNVTEQPERVTTNGVNFFDGSISLNITPFKPLPTPPCSDISIVDLISEDEIENSSKTVEKSTMKWRSLPKHETPTKWTKQMTKFYTKPSTRKLKMELSNMFKDLKRNSTADDWKLDPRDELGIYQRTPLLRGKHKNRRCPNCNERGHLVPNCPKPRKVPTCHFCGQPYHSASSCPNKICFKCGVYKQNDAFEECLACYNNTFNYDPCHVCGQPTHWSEICPDLWRSFHATVDGDKKIPEHITENERKYCCNCATKGHFSHQCPFPSWSGDQANSFVTNYSAPECDDGTTEIVIPDSSSYVFDTPEGDRFLQQLSNNTQAVIEVGESRPIVLHVKGTFEQCKKVRGEVEEYINIRKRKRHEPFPKRKRRRMR